MDEANNGRPKRRSRFRRASEPPAFRVTDGDVVIIRQIARHRFLKSTHIAALVGRSLDRTNDRLSRLFHAGYIDRPRGQLDYYPTSGSAPMVYALADRGARLLAERGGGPCANVDWNRKNREVGRPFVDHQLEVTGFYVSLQRAVRDRADVRLIHPDELVASFPEQTRAARNPLSMPVCISHEGAMHEIGLVPDLVFGLRFANGSRRCFMVEIDRGTMPVVRAKITLTSFERKMRAYLAAHAAGQHETQFGWKTFRVLTVTTDGNRMNSMIDALRPLRVADGPGASLFFFATRDQLRASDPLAHSWRDGNSRQLRLI